MIKPPFPETAPDFTDPIGLLRTCHQKILFFAEQLELLLPQLQSGALGLQTASDCSKIYTYFHKAGAEHHKDEEEQLFPKLARVSLKLADKVHKMRKQHQQMDALWQQIAPQLSRPNTISDADSFVEQCSAFIELQREHVAYENEEILDMVPLLFNANEIKKLGKEMAERRGITLPIL